MRLCQKLTPPSQSTFSYFIRCVPPLINLAEIQPLNARGVDVLIQAQKAAKAEGATIKLWHVEDKVREALEMTRLIGVFETFDDEIDAIASFRDG